MAGQVHYSDSSTTLLTGEALAVLAGLPDGCVDAVITDPPYSSGGQFRGDRAQSTAAKYLSSDTGAPGVDFAGDTRDQRAYGYWTALWTSEALRCSQPGSPLLAFTDWRQLPQTVDAVQAGGWTVRGIAVWDKVNGRPRRGGFTGQTEYVVWATAGALTSPLEVYLPGVLRHSAPRGKARQHQTQKPLPLMAELVRLCPPGGTVLDPFAGSGTTGVAAAQAGRQAILVERVAHYADVIADRLRAEGHPPPR